MMDDALAILALVVTDIAVTAGTNMAIYSKVSNLTSRVVCIETKHHLKYPGE